VGVIPDSEEDLLTTTKTRVNKIGTVVIPVADQEAAIEFYTEKLGFEKRVDVPVGDSYRWVEVAPGDAVTTLAIVPPPPGGSTGNRETGVGLQTDDIDAFHAELKASGVDVDAEVSRMGDPVPPLFWLRDPEGNSLMVVQ
jgi:catechol 2,3-dioxygenase-like lactoylglutathione lyase family enzyme